MKIPPLLVSILFLGSCTTPLIITKKNIELYYIIEEGKLGYIDQKGKTRIEPKFEVPEEQDFNSDCTLEFNGGSFAIVKESGRYNIINWTGSKTNPFPFDEIIPQSDSSFIAKQNGKYGLINHQGETIVPFIFDSQFFINTNVFPGKIDNKYVVYNPANKSIIDLPYDRVSPFFRNYAEVGTNGKIGLINKDLQLVLDTTYQELGYFRSGRINAKIDNQWIFINIHGNMVISDSFKEASRFENGIATVKKDKYGAIDTSGNIVVPFQYEYLSYEGLSYNGDHVFMFCDQEKYYRSGSKRGLVNQDLDTLLNPDYNNLFYFFDIVEASLSDHAQSGVIDLKKKKIIIPFIFDDTWYYEDGLSTLYFSDEDEKQYFGYVNRRNKIIWSNNRTLLKKKLKKGFNKTLKR
jgi:hypothetical protein